jgi:RuvB-like protein 1 (pontin 52)
MSLRDALQLLSPSQILAEVDQRVEVKKEDVEEAKELLIDTGASITILKESEDKYFHLASRWHFYILK